MYSTQYLFLLLISLFLISCEPSQSTTDVEEVTNEVAMSSEEEKPVAMFVANPQPITKREIKTLEVGSPAPDFSLPDMDGVIRSLADYKEAKVLTIIFTANHCPTAQAYEERMKAYQSDYADQGVQLVAISPNSPLGLLYNELGYSDLNDDFKTMKIRAEHHEWNFPYLYDGDDHAASFKYGPVATPHVFVFDSSRTLRYVGRLDKSERPGTANAEDLRAATDAILAGSDPAEPTTKTFGCSTKWAWKTEYKEKTNAEWNSREVELSSIDLAGVEALVKNDDSDKLRLINLWATWCGPCVLEYPDFLILQRMYEGRDFEFVSISLDKPDQDEKALKFLQKVHSPVANYHFSGKDVYELVEAIDPDWNGAIPYTLLVEPGGKVVWSHQAEVDFLDLKRAIVDHEMIGRYF